MYVETFEEILRKILRYRNNSEKNLDSDNKFRMDLSNFKYDYNDFIAIIYDNHIEDYGKSKKMKGKVFL
jgi:flagellar biosynthesis chaperone FliJ